MDMNDYYGGESTSLNLNQLWKKFRGEEKAPEHLGSSRDYNVDMMPKFMMGNGKLVRTLIHTDVTKYLSFKAVDGSYVFVKGKVTGPMHMEVANCCRYLAMVLYHAGDMAGAIMQQHKELIINERCLGLDHPDTAHSYGNMALFYHGLNQTELALQNMGRALLLLGLSSCPDHPDVAATFINVAMMYQDLGKMDTSLRYLQDALKKIERLLGPEHIQTTVCYHALAIACNSMGLFKLSQQHEKKTYDIFVKQLGEDDSRTKDSQNWMKNFEMRELQKTAQKHKGQAVNAANTQKAIDLLKVSYLQELFNFEPQDRVL